MKIKYFLSDVHCCGLVRAEVIARVVNRDFPGHNLDCKTHIFMSDYYNTDVMVFQRQHHPANLQKMEVAKRWGIKTVYDIDDDLFHIPPGFEKPYQFYSDPQVQNTIHKYLMTCDAVTTSTVVLAEQMRKYTNTPIYVVENALDVSFWAREPVAKDTVTIGWMASGSHKLDVPLVKKALARLMHEFPRVNIKMIGWVDLNDLPFLRQFEGRVDVLPWQDAAVLPDIMADIDIGLCPIVKNVFNDSKSGIKAMQYWASKTAVVCSESPAYNLVHDKVDALVAETPEDWYEHLRKLVLDTEYRKDLGNAGYAELVRKHNMDVNARNWVGLFEKICQN